MPCKNCKIKPVIKLPNTNVSLCKSCFIKYFEKKVLKTIREYNLLNPNEKIGVAVSGGKDSLTTLYLINKLASTKMPLNVVAIAIDEGIHDYRSITLEDAKKFCNENNIDLHIVSYKKEFGYTLDEMLTKTKRNPCSICGVLIRYLLNKKC